MATEEYLHKYMELGKRYEDLPARFKMTTTEEEWRRKVKEYCISRGFSWVGTVANTVVSEHDYYEELVKYYRTNKRLFPYHLAEYVCRMMRITPFRYYTNILYDAMKDDRPYDSIPNFTAADIVRIMGIGRNEYIATMVQAKSKKLLWRVNKGIVKDLLPQEPLDVPIDPWWVVHVVNVGEAEYRQLSPEELQVCHMAARPGGARASDTNLQAVRQLYRRGVIWLEVPVRPEDHLSIPPLEGFVSNKTSTAGAADADPLESLLYQIFVAASDRVTVSKLAAILGVDVQTLRVAISMACRLRFCRRLEGAEEGGFSPAAMGLAASIDQLDLDSLLKQETPAAELDTEALDSAQGGGEGVGVAFVVDAEVTGYLMMGALTPNCKKHSVTLFEGGRVYGADVINELIDELHASVAMSEGFEGEMKNLVNYARSLAIVLETISSCAGGRPIELLRKESVASLPPARAFSILSHSYGTILPITTLPFPPLPLSLQRAGPVNYGPTPAAATPWMNLALYVASSLGPKSVVLVAGQHFNRLLPQLRGCSYALLWPWDAAAVKAQSVPVLVEGPHLLYNLNCYLAHTALLVQPLELPTGQAGAASAPSLSDLPQLSTVDVPLPLPRHADAAQAAGVIPTAMSAAAAAGIADSAGAVSEAPGEGWAGSDWGDFEAAGSANSSRGNLLSLNIPAVAPAAEGPTAGSAALPAAADVGPLQVDGLDSEGNLEAVQLPGSVVGAIAALGLSTALGYLRLLRVPGGGVVPLQVCLGMPMQPSQLCQAVCNRARAVGFLDQKTRRQQQEGQQALQRSLYSLISQHGACSCSFVGVGRDADLSSFVDRPVHNLMFEEGCLAPLDCSTAQQGPCLWR